MVEIEFFGCAPIWGHLVASYDRIFRELDVYVSKDRLVSPQFLVELRAVAHSCMGGLCATADQSWNHRLYRHRCGLFLNHHLHLL